MRFEVSPQVGVRRIGEEIFVLAPSGDLVILKAESGTFLWEQIEDGVKSEPDLVARLTDAFDVEEDTAGADVRRFLDRLEALGIILPAG